MRRLLPLILLCCFAVPLPAQSKADVSTWNWLIGTWDGNGSGKPGEGAGWFSFKPDLESKVLVRKAHSEYPATADKPRIVHDDLMIVYREATNWRADYWDNEGHVIHYSIALAANKAVFTSDRQANAPTFRLSYDVQPNGEVTTAFAIAAPGSEEFKTYVTGTSHRRKD